MSDAETQELLGRLGQLETGQVSDVLDEAGLPNQAVHNSIGPIGPVTRFAGVAVCARGQATVRGEKPAAALGGTALDDAMFPGAVALIDSGGFTGGACLGGFVAFSYQRAGCRAVITSGAIRDAEEIRQLGLPVFARATTPVNGSRRFGLVELGRPIPFPSQSGGVLLVSPGDLVLGDADGIVVIPREAARSIIEDAEELQRIERRIGEELRKGEARGPVFKRNPRFAHVRPVAAGS